MIAVSDVSKSFGQTRAVQNLSCTIAAGEVVGFLGPNGAGKTTTLRLLSGYCTPDSGQILINGHALTTDRAAAQAALAYMPETNPLYDTMLVSEFLQLTATLRGFDHAKTQTQLNRVVPAVALNDFYYRPIGELSKGYRQRVGIAAALLADTPVLILDEPTEGLDPQQRSDIRALISELAKERTIIMSTHVLSEAQAVADRIIIINNGHIVADGTTASLQAEAATTTRWQLAVRGADVVTQLKQLSGVEVVTTHADPLAENRYDVVVQEGVDFPARLMPLLRTGTFTLTHLMQEQNSLEHIFMSVTNEATNNS